ncbi:MAG: uncharacterized protein JWN86_3387 [Planctomycetota bacterium]|nr:uncharacterized protein [Planctomycetota bacterium]
MAIRATGPSKAAYVRTTPLAAFHHKLWQYIQPQFVKDVSAQALNACGASTMQTPLEELIELIADRPNGAFLLIGSGVSIASTQNALLASWRGLLSHGVSYCVSQLGLDVGWETRRKQSLEAFEYIQVATDIAERLRAPNSGRFAEWLEKTIGTLTVKDPRLIDALKRWGLNISTTNYDWLIESRTGFTPITWQDQSRFTQFASSASRDVLHLHGDYRHPDSVVFDARSYYEVGRFDAVQQLMQALCLVRSPVFIGCGPSGLDDPNIGSLVRWCREKLDGMVRPGYLIAVKADVEEWQRILGSSQIRVISCGSTHADLPGFLEEIAIKIGQRRAAPRPAADSLSAAQPGFDESVKALLSAGSSRGLAETVRELMKLAKAHCQAGGRRSAWRAVSGRLERDGEALPIEERVQFTLELAEMLLSDDREEEAFHALLRIAEAVASQEISPTLRESYWSFRARCLKSMGFYSDAREILDRAIESSEAPETRARLRAERAEILFLQTDESIPEANDLEVGISDEMGPNTLLLESVTPEVRHALIDLRVMAMRGIIAASLKKLSQTIGDRTAANHIADVVALAMLRSEILHLEERHDEAREQFDQAIRPRLASLGSLSRFAVRQNYVDLRSQLQNADFADSVDDFYHLQDLRKIIGHRPSRQ